MQEPISVVPEGTSPSKSSSCPAAAILNQSIAARRVGSLQKDVRGAGEQRLFCGAVGFRKGREGTIKLGADREKR